MRREESGEGAGPQHNTQALEGPGDNSLVAAYRGLGVHAQACKIHMVIKGRRGPRSISDL